MFQAGAREQLDRVREAEIAFKLTYGQGRFRMPGPEEMLDEMDGAGVGMAVLCPFPWMTLEACAENNDYLLELAASWPERFIPFAVTNPSLGRQAAREARRCLEGGALGLGEFHSQPQGFDILDLDTMAPLVELAREYDVPLMVHTNEPVGHTYPGKGPIGPAEMYRFILAFPEMKLILPHWGGGLVFYELMPEVARDCANVYYDSAASPFLYRSEIYDLAASIAGARKILFATDYPLIPYERTISDARAGISSEEHARDIMGGNAARLFGTGIDSH